MKPLSQRNIWKMLGSGVSPVLDQSFALPFALPIYLKLCQHLKDKATVIEIQKSAKNGCRNPLSKGSIIFFLPIPVRGQQPATAALT